MISKKDYGVALTKVYPSLSIASSTHSRNGSLPLQYPAIADPLCLPIFLVPKASMA
jgi:hypothetical protein